MSCLVTGASGFVGRYVQSEVETCLPLVQQGEIVDLRDAAALSSAVKQLGRLDAVIHLAALTFVPESFEDPNGVFAVNFQGTHHLLEALRHTGFSGRFLYVGSADTYGRVDQAALPVTEAQPLRPRNPYAVSKVAAEALCYQWSQTGPFEIMMVRPFNHIGAGQDPRFAVADFARQMARIKLGRAEPVLTVGDIDVTRDFTDVRDVACAYRLLLEHGHNGEIYNVCSGSEVSLRTIIDRLAVIAGVAPVLRKDLMRLRPSEQRRMLGSHARLTADTGWEPSRSLDDSLHTLFDHWMETLTRE